MSDTYYACYEANQGNYWTCEGPYNNLALADAFIKDKICPRRTFIVAAPSYAPTVIREQIVINNLLKTIQPSIIFKDPGADSGDNICHIGEWHAH